MRGLSINYKTHNIYVTAFIATIGGMLFGFDISSVSAFVGEDNYQNYFFADGSDSTKQSGITASMPAGSFLGSLCAFPFSDRYGRKFVIQAASLIWCIGAAIQSSAGAGSSKVANRVAQLVIGRLIGGFAIGMASSQVPVYIAEISPRKIRGRLVGMFQWSVTWGILIMFYISYGCSTMDGVGGFRLAWGLQIVPGLILFAGTLILEESPRWLASKDRWDEALAIISKTQAKGTLDDPAVKLEVEEIKEAVRLEHNSRVGLVEMFRGKTNLRRTFVGIWCQIWQQLTGMNVLMYYVVNVFTMAGYSSKRSTTVIASSIQYVLNTVMTIPALLWVDMVGRRKLLLFGSTMLMAWLFALTGLFGQYSLPTGPEGYKSPDDPNAQPNSSIQIYIPQDKKPVSHAIIAICYLFVCTFAPTWGPLGWIYCSEIFPLEQRATGNSLTAAANWAFNFAISMFTLPGFENITWKTYAIYASCCAAMTVHVFFMFPETKGKTLEEIDMMWKSGVPAWKSASWQPDLPNIRDIGHSNIGRAPSEKNVGEIDHAEDVNSVSDVSEKYNQNTAV